MKYIVLIGILLLSLPLSFAYEITEIMYDPQGSDTNREWIEVYGNPLDDVIFIEGSTRHTLERIQGNCEEDCVSIVADKAERFLAEYSVGDKVLIYEAGWSSLKNTGEYVALEKNASVVVELDYEPISSSGESLQLQGENYIADQPTPGIYDVEEMEEVPEFGVLGALVVLATIGFFIFRNRKD